MSLHFYLQKRTQEKRIVSYAPTLWDSFFAVQHHCKLRKEGSIFLSVPMPQAMAIISNNVIRILSTAPIKGRCAWIQRPFYFITPLCLSIRSLSPRGNISRKRQKNRYYSTRLRLIFPPPAKRDCESRYAVNQPTQLVHKNVKARQR